MFTRQAVTFENVTRFGELLSRNSPDVEIGPHASGIRFLGDETNNKGEAK